MKFSHYWFLFSCFRWRCSFCAFSFVLSSSFG